MVARGSIKRNQQCKGVIHAIITGVVLCFKEETGGIVQRRCNQRLHCFLFYLYDVCFGLIS